MRVALILLLLPLALAGCISFSSSSPIAARKKHDHCRAARIQQLSIDPGLIMPCERLRFSRSPGYLRKEMLAVLNGFVAA